MQLWFHNDIVPEWYSQTVIVGMVSTIWWQTLLAWPFSKICHMKTIYTSIVSMVSAVRIWSCLKQHLFDICAIFEIYYRRYAICCAIEINDFYKIRSGMACTVKRFFPVGLVSTECNIAGMVSNVRHTFIYDVLI